MAEEIGATGHDAKCVPNNDGTYSIVGGVTIYVPPVDVGESTPFVPSTEAVDDLSQGPFQSEDHCLEILVTELNKYEFLETQNPQVPADRAQKDKPDRIDSKPEQHNKENKPADRTDSNLPDNQEKKKDDTLKPNSEKKQDSRGGTMDPQTEESKQGEEYTGGTFLQDVEHWIPSLVEPAKQGIVGWKKDLEEGTQDGESPILGALAASGLDVLDTTIAMTEGIPIGLLDIRKVGEGTVEAINTVQGGGSLADAARGLKKDASRVLTIAGYIFPEAAAIKAANRAMAGADIVDSLSQGDFKTAAIQLGTTALHEKAAGRGRNKLGTDPPPPPKKVGTPGSRGKQRADRSEMDTTDFLRKQHPNKDWSEQVIVKDKVVKGSGRPPKDSTVPDAYSKDMGVAVESKRWEDISNIKLQKLKDQLGGRLRNLPEGTKQWLVVDFRGEGLSLKGAVAKHAELWKKLGGDSVLEKIYIVTEDGVFEFSR